MTKTLLTFGVSLGIIAALSITYITFFPLQAQGDSGLQSTVASSTNLAVTTTAKLAFATSTCTARVISTGGSVLKIGIAGKLGQTPTAVNGITQPASSTVVYDSSLYGCDAWRIYSYEAQTITITEQN